jgi:hypothetical protein
VSLPPPKPADRARPDYYSRLVPAEILTPRMRRRSPSRGFEPFNQSLAADHDSCEAARSPCESSRELPGSPAKG